jgi:hypothetical protein
MTRFGMDVVLAHPPGYSLMTEVEEVALSNSQKYGGSYTRVESMPEAFKDADIVYPKSWAPYAVMEKRTQLLKDGDLKGLKDLEKSCLENNKKFIDWECRRSRSVCIRALPGAAVQPGRIQALHYCGHDLFEQVRGAGGKTGGVAQPEISESILKLTIDY